MRASSTVGHVQTSTLDARLVLLLCSRIRLFGQDRPASPFCSAYSQFRFLRGSRRLTTFWERKDRSTLALSNGYLAILAARSSDGGFVRRLHLFLGELEIRGELSSSFLHGNGYKGRECSSFSFLIFTQLSRPHPSSLFPPPSSFPLSLSALPSRFASSSRPLFS